ncbi:MULTISPECIES: DUF2530 domain-containing protein [Gordonia]|uniref:DUF2530 domain-containing protein n=2 Tax=Gordonia TaxID=2053 RepID=L7LH02_9ACTN|nr:MULTISPECIES: DUF2530 domain-containing protein [Gordonia]AUH69885.1 DUF2530 domain-containing protein [Gordonia sp. YC-JH1]KJR06178.1 membrane protein [Gordonia sihwensis]KXT57065.1 membrane protein [Gordonia sp. QH-12]MBY4570514.1 hypothetical protein [Gordonia sihwensis]WFN93508.1 DUF2530 domain-containing protein [Gordonia sihwensis]
MSDESEIPQLPARLRAPEPVIVAGMLIWTVATLVVWLGGVGPDSALPVCLVGLGVGVLGTGVVLLQKAAVRRGSRGAQEGLDVR